MAESENIKSGITDVITAALNTVTEIISVQQSNNNWKISSDGQDYANKKQEKEFYDSLKSKNKRKSDAIRKYKQQKIEELKKGKSK